MERVRAMIGISFYLYEMGSARAPKGFPWWTAGMKIDPRVPNTLIRKDYSLVNFTNIFPVSTQIRYLSKPQKWYSCGHGVFHARGQRHLPHGIILAAGQGCRTRPRPASPSPATRRNSAAGDLQPQTVERCLRNSGRA